MMLSTDTGCICGPPTTSRRRRVSVGAFQPLLIIAPSSSDFTASQNDGECANKRNDGLVSANCLLSSAASTVVATGKWAVNNILKSTPPVATSQQQAVSSSLSLLAAKITSDKAIREQVAMPPASAASTLPILANSNNSMQFTQFNDDDRQTELETLVPRIRVDHRRSMRLPDKHHEPNEIEQLFKRLKQTKKLTTCSQDVPKPVITGPVAEAAANSATKRLLNYDNGESFFKRGAPGRHTLMVTPDSKIGSDVFAILRSRLANGVLSKQNHSSEKNISKFFKPSFSINKKTLLDMADHSLIESSIV